MARIVILKIPMAAAVLLVDGRFLNLLHESWLTCEHPWVIERRDWMSKFRYEVVNFDSDSETARITFRFKYANQAVLFKLRWATSSE